MVLRHWSSAALVAFAMAVSAPAFAAEKTEDFVKKTAAANQFEIESSKIVAAKAVSPALKKFAADMVADHTKAKADFESTLKTANIAFSPAQLENKQLDIIDNLNKADVAALEKDYIKAQKDAHKDVVGMFKDYAKDGDNAQLKAWAAKMLPDLEKHLAQVDALD
jgi:putative membrane protein